MYTHSGGRPKVKRETEKGDISMPEFHGQLPWRSDGQVRPSVQAASHHWRSDSRSGCDVDEEGGAQGGMSAEERGSYDVNKDGGTRRCKLVDERFEDGYEDGGARHWIPASPKTPKFSGKSSWEAYQAQFELLAAAAGWPDATKALQLALSLTEDASTCLLLLSPEERGDYVTLVGALQRRFGESNLRDSLRCEFKHRIRQPGESLRVLAYEIESLSRRAYADMPPSIQSELARDQFVQALTPDKLRLHVQFSHPASLSEALDRAIERETVVCAMKPSASPSITVAAVAEASDQRPAWAEELVRAVRTQAARPPRGNSGRRPLVCWGCGQPGHLLRNCNAVGGQQGNGAGSV